MIKKIAVLGSTGSIGTQTLEVIKNNPHLFCLTACTAYSDGEKLKRQAREFGVKFAALVSESGEDCLIEAVKDCDTAVIATSGITALKAVLYCLSHNIETALANKEVLVCAGRAVTDAVKTYGAELYPVDSEHSAVRQCIAGGGKPAELILTASGGPFLALSREQLKHVKKEDALKHPTWSMGRKITVDSATMMNKAFEIVEAHWLFDMPAKNLDIIIHPESVIHSLVRFPDNSYVAQLAATDMKLPILYALNGCKHEECVSVKPLVLSELPPLTFSKCDYERFPCAKYGKEIIDGFPLMGTLVNAANDICVEAFLNGKLLFDAFSDTIDRTVEHFYAEYSGENADVQEIIACDAAVKAYVRSLF